MFIHVTMFCTCHSISIALPPLTHLHLYHKSDRYQCLVRSSYQLVYLQSSCSSFPPYFFTFRVLTFCLFRLLSLPLLHFLEYIIFSYADCSSSTHAFLLSFRRLQKSISLRTRKASLLDGEFLLHPEKVMDFV